MHKVSWFVLGLAAFVSAGLMLCAGCSGHNHDAGLGDEPLAPDPTLLGEANEQRLEPAGSGAANALAIAGTITMQGLTLVDNQGINVPTNKTNTKLMVQLVDEEDDILVAKSPATSGAYSLSIFTPSLSVRLRVTCTVAEDLNGDGAGNDTLTQDVPVQLVSGKTVSMNLSFKKAAQTDMQPVLWPVKGFVLLCDMSRTDGAGSKTSFYGTFFADHFVITSLDGDRLLEDGDDLRQPDMDGNGWPDPSEAIYGDAALSSAMLSGIIISVDVANQTLVLRSKDGEKTVVFLSTFCTIEPFSNGSFYGQVPLSADLIGKAATVTGELGPGGIVAYWIVYTP